MTNDFLVFHYTSDYEGESVLEIFLIDMNPDSFIRNGKLKDKFTITPLTNLYVEDGISMMLKGLIPHETDHIVSYIEFYKDVQLPRQYNTYIITTNFNDDNFLLKRNAMLDFSIAN